MKGYVAMFAFLGGVGTGTAIGMFISKKKFLKRVDKEIEAAKKLYSNADNLVKKYETPTAETVPFSDVIDELEKVEQAKEVSEKKNYTDYAAMYAPQSDEKSQPISEEKNLGDSATKKMKKARPIFIDEEEFGEDESYEQVSLTYYADGVITEEDDVKPFDTCFGVPIVQALDNLFADGEDVIYMRDTTNKIDYEITHDRRSFNESVMLGGPEDE